jgi:hypothetical protein
MIMEKTGKDDDHKRADKDQLIKMSKEQSVELSEDELGQVDGGSVPTPPGLKGPTLIKPTLPTTGSSGVTAS